MKRTLKKLIRGEKGQALLIVLILMLVGGLIIAPLLSHIGTGNWVGKIVYEEKMYRLYAADAGVEDALWQIKNEKLGSKLAGYDEYNYGYPYPYPDYPNSLVVNDKNVGVTIENVWVPDIDEPSSSDEALNIAKYGNTVGEGQVAPRLIITGNPSSANPATQYQIGINYYYGSEGTGVLKVEEIGVWLPPGFHYVSVSSPSGLGTPSNPSYKGGEAVIWTFSSTLFKNLPGVSTSTNPMVETITFNYTADTAGQIPSCVSWIETSGDASKVGSIPYAWDADKKVYGINSVAKDTTGTPPKQVEIDAYALKTDPRELGSGMAGDYVAVGSSLMLPDPNNQFNGQDFRNRLLKESSAPIYSYSGDDEPPLGYIPADATVQRAYLYWSGFIDHYYWYYYIRPSGPGPKPATGWYFSNDADNALGSLYDSYELSTMFANARVNKVSFGVSGDMHDVTASQWQVCEKSNDSPNCWYYTCYYDATADVKQLIDSGKLGANGSGTYTVGHASQSGTTVINQLRPGFDLIPTPTYPSGNPSETTKKGYAFLFYDKSGTATSDYTGYPLGTPATKLPDGYSSTSYNPNKQTENYPSYPSEPNRYHASYAGWSLVIIYSSPATQGHQLYLYDIRYPNFKFVESFPTGAYGPNPDFDGDGSPGGKVSGFIVPQRVQKPDGTWETNAARITCFVGEGDETKYGDYFKFKGQTSSQTNLLDGTGAAANNCWNSKSLVLPSGVSGIDIDTLGINPSADPPQYITWASGLLKTGETSAEINIPTEGDGFTLIYIILSFRSSITYGGTISYLVEG